MNTKPKLLPLSVPWMVATSAPFLKVQHADDSTPLSVTFVAYFKLADTGVSSVIGQPEVATDPGPFEALENDDYNPYHLVRINFTGGLAARAVPSFSDGETIEEDAYDWSAIPGALLPGEDALENHKRTIQFWFDHSISPDPRFYVVQNSPWLKDLGVTTDDYQLFLILGQDEYVEVVAKSASCEIGQGV